MDGLHAEDTSSFEAAGLSGIVAACERFEAQWRDGGDPRIEDFLEGSDPSGRERLLRELLAIDIELRAVRGESPAPEDYLERFPDWAAAVADVFSRRTFESPRSDITSAPTAGPLATVDRGLNGHGPPGGDMVDTVESPLGLRPRIEPAEHLPERFGRYAVLSRLGRGGFGSVYLARDEELGRFVAIKVLHPGVLRGPGQVESFLAEARIAAGLVHPGIVRVYDVGRYGEGEAFVVFEHVEGRDLSRILKSERPSPAIVAGLMARIAEAAHHAHVAGMVHRDLKPSNILVDAHGAPHIADFGLAMRGGAQHLLAGEVAGTPAFMAPEQIRGETHRFDGRTDVWAIGVILYLALTGKLPFPGKDRAQVFREILEVDPQPPRQLDPAVPRELERIALKCLAKRMADRYETAAELADDLGSWLAAEGLTAPATTPGAGLTSAPSWRMTPPPARIVPKGLRTFDPEDADFFPSLVHGPRDREGLPESIRSWRRRLEEPDPDRSFPVGLIYGPSGGGKSSFVRAGLLPRLARWIRPIYIEATAEGTEARLLAALRRAFPGLPTRNGLAGAAAALREGRTARGGSKVLVVLDQFEQWLHAHPEASDGDLVRALRQCDGAGLQAILLVRDDFWMAITRFLRVLEVRPIEGFNSAAIEPFDTRHATRVLAELGRALGRLHDPPGPEEARFLERAVKELAGTDGRIIPVRLTLLAEMLRHREWTTATLRELGGFEGIGVRFLEETFCAPTAPPAHRVHQQAAQAVLKALLPEPSSDLKGRIHPASELREAAGYRDRPADFDELIALLDSELRMVTPVDPSGAGREWGVGSGEWGVGREVPGGEVGGERRVVGEDAGQDPTTPDGAVRPPIPHSALRTAHYQLTHDYLVPPVRQWLTRKQRETRRGRAELRLATITSLWREHPESRRLPSLLEWLTIVGFTRPGGWSDDERRMMRAATRHVLLRAAAAVLIVGAMAGAIAVDRQRQRTASLFEGAVDADFRRLPGLIPELERYRGAFRRELVELEANDGARPQHREVARILLYRDRPTAVLGSALRDRLTAPQAQPEEVEVIRGALAVHPAEAGAESLRRVLRDEDTDPAARLRAAGALQALVPTFANDPDLRAAAPALTEALLVEPRREFPLWLELLGPAAEELVPHLVAIRRDAGRESYARDAATEALAHVLGRGDRDLELARNIVEASPLAAKVLLREFDGRKPSPEALEFLRDAASEAVSDDPERVGQDELADRQAAAAAALAALGESDRLWPLLLRRDDPRVRSLLIQRLVDTVPSRVLVERLARPTLDAGECRALLLAWAEARRGAAPTWARAQVAERARRLYVEHPDPGVHAAAGLLLRRWDEARFVAQADRDATAPLVGPDGRGWERGPNGHTFAILPGPLEFRMGSPPHEQGRLVDQVPHSRKIDRSLAVSMTEVTLEQLRALEQGRSLAPGAGEHGPVAGGIDWFRAVRYCNRLSHAAGIDPGQWCYPEKTDDVQVVPADAVDREGFRLPTEAEWEYICRAGTGTARPFGESQRLLPRYAWTWLNSDDRPHPVGQLLPNDFGLFDILGNVWEWCQDGPAGAYGEVPMPPYPPGTPEHPAPDPVRREDAAVSDGREVTWRILRGGSFNYAPVKARSAHRDWIGADDGRSSLGFRVVRTLRRPPLGTAPPDVAARRVEAVARPGGP